MDQCKKHLECSVLAEKSYINISPFLFISDISLIGLVLLNFILLLQQVFVILLYVIFVIFYFFLFYKLSEKKSKILMHF